MQSPPDNNAIKIKPLNLILLFAILQFLTAYLTIYSGLSFDEAIWHYIGRNWFRHGLAPYSGGVDNKSPLIYIIYGSSDWLFGVNPWFPRVIAIIVQCTGIYFLYRIAKDVSGYQAGMIAILFYGLSLLWRSTGGKVISLTQVYEVTLLIVSFYLYLVGQKSRQLFISGLLGGLAFGFRFSAGFALLIVPILLLRRRSNLSLLVFLAGVISALALLIALFSLMGVNIREFLSYSFSDNFTSESITDHPLTWKLEQFADAFFYSELILFYPFVITYLLIKKRIDMFVLWLIASFAGILVIGMFARTHLKELLPSLCVMSAVSVDHILTNYKIPVRATLLVLLVCFFPKTFEPLLALKKLFVPEKDNAMAGCAPPYVDNDDCRKHIGLWIKSNTQTTNKVYIAGNSAQAQVYSERISPTIYFNATQTKEAKKRLLLDLSAARPAMIVVPPFIQPNGPIDRETRSFLNELLTKDYQLDTCLYGYNIYRYKENY